MMKNWFKDVNQIIDVHHKTQSKKEWAQQWIEKK